MVADREIVHERCARIRRYVADLRDLAQISPQVLRRNRERQYAVLHALQRAIEASIEIGTRICSADALGVPSSYAETFDLLERGGVLSSKVADPLRAMARFRNRIVHFYAEVDLDEVHRVITTCLDDFQGYLGEIEQHLELDT